MIKLYSFNTNELKQTTDFKGNNKARRFILTMKTQTNTNEERLIKSLTESLNRFGEMYNKKLQERKTAQQLLNESNEPLNRFETDELKQINTDILLSKVATGKAGKVRR